MTPGSQIAQLGARDDRTTFMPRADLTSRDQQSITITMANTGWRTRVGVTLVAAGLAGVVLAWGHYPPHQHALEGLFSRSWPQSAASSAWATVRVLARLSIFAGVLIVGGYERVKLLDKDFLVWLVVVGVLIGVALLTPIGAWPLFAWLIVSSLWTVGSWIASSE